MAATALNIAAACVAFFACPASAAGSSGSSFLGARGDLLAEIEGAIGAETTGGRIAAMEATLRPMFVAMPKNRQGRLGNSAVRYVLHRFFVQLHGWVIAGLEPGSGANATSAATGERAAAGVSVLNGKVSAWTQELFEERLGGAGLGLREVAAVAVALERLIHNEASGRLRMAFDRLDVAREAELSGGELEKVLDAYMALYLLGSSLDENSYSMQRLIPAMPKVYAGWQDTKVFVSDTKHNIEFSQRHRSNPFVVGRPNFDTALRVVESVGERFGQHQDVECQELKEALVEREIRDSGRVTLADFYKIGLGGKFLLRESVDYLRSLGALDESSARAPRVIVPNVVLSKSNCLASTSLYTVCCINECEPLMAHIEHAIAAPSARAQHIAGLVSQLPFATVEAPRNLSDALLRRLEDIAAGHNGAVLLHGRLFAQWMHNAFPRECPFPHLSETTVSLALVEWQNVSVAKDPAAVSRMGVEKL